MLTARIVAPLGNRGDVDAALRALVSLNRYYLRRYGARRPLLTSGIRYRREPRGREDWQTIPVLYEARSGDCEDLAAALAAELGGAARALRSSSGYHIVTVLPGGRTVDPSAALGMET